MTSLMPSCAGYGNSWAYLEPRTLLASVLAVVLLTLGMGCESSRSTVRIDLQSYLQRSKSWAPIEAEAAQAIERILRTQFVDEATVLHLIADTRPRLERHLEWVREYRPRSRAVERVHARYIDSWQELLAAYDAIEQGFATADYTKLARGREAMGAWRDGILGVAEELRTLVRDFGIDPADPPETRARSDACVPIRDAAHEIERIARGRRPVLGPERAIDGPRSIGVRPPCRPHTSPMLASSTSILRLAGAVAPRAGQPPTRSRTLRGACRNDKGPTPQGGVGPL